MTTYAVPSPVPHSHAGERPAAAEAHSGEAPVESPQDRLFRQTGILERRYALPDEASSDLASRALADALDGSLACTLPSGQAPVRPHVAALIVATTSPDYPSPATASYVHAALGLAPETLAFDVASSCSSFLSATLAALGFCNGKAPVAVAAAEVKHKSLGSDLRMRALFSDGAAGCVFLPSEGTRPGAVSTGAVPLSRFALVYNKVDSELSHHIQIPVGGSRRPVDASNALEWRLRMLEPKLVYRHTVHAFAEAIEAGWHARAAYLASLGHDPEVIPGLVYAHQANANILRDVCGRLPPSLSARIPVLMEDVGNMVCAALPVARTRLRLLERLWMPDGFQEPLPDSDVSQESPGKDADAAGTRGAVRVRKDANGTFLFSSGEIEGREFLSVRDESGGIFLQGLSAPCLARVHAALEAGVHGAGLHQGSGTPRVDLWVAAGGGFQTVCLLHATENE